MARAKHRGKQLQAEIDAFVRRVRRAEKHEETYAPRKKRKKKEKVAAE